MPPSRTSTAFCRSPWTRTAIMTVRRGTASFTSAQLGNEPVVPRRRACRSRHRGPDRLRARAVRPLLPRRGSGPRRRRMRTPRAADASATSGRRPRVPNPGSPRPSAASSRIQRQVPSSATRLVRPPRGPRPSGGSPAPGPPSCAASRCAVPLARHVGVGERRVHRGGDRGAAPQKQRVVRSLGADKVHGSGAQARVARDPP